MPADEAADGARPSDAGARPSGEAATAEAELRTFLIADIRGYTTYTQEHGANAAARLATDFATIVREVVARHDGFLLELRGDEALAVFVLARRALRAALELQTRFALDLPRGVGIGLDAGEAIPVEGGYRGSALNLAARLCGQAGPGETLASEAVIHLAAKVDGIGYADPKTFRIKGIETPIRAVHVVPEAQGSRRPIRYGREGGLDRRLLAVVGIGLAAILVGIAAWAGPLGGLGGSEGRAPSSAADASPTPTPSLAPEAADIDPDDLPLTVFLDPTTGDVRDVLAEPRGAADVVFADGSFWVFDRQPRAIHEVDPETGGSERPISIAFDVAAFTIGGGRIFVAEPERLIHVFDVASRREVDTFTYEISNPIVTLPYPIYDLAYGDGSLWIAGGWSGDVTRMDPASGEIEVSIPTNGAGDRVAFADGAVWAVGSWPSGQVSQIDASRNEVTRRTAIPQGAGALDAGGGAAWVANSASGTVTRVDELGQATSYSVGGGIAALAYDDAAGTVWTASLDGSVASIDILTGAVRATYLGQAATAIASDGGRVLAGLTRTQAEILASLPSPALRIATNDGLWQIDPAAFDLSPTTRQYADATCASLLRRRADPGSDGELLEPLVAAAMPEVSEDGRTYSFTVRDGFAFSPPSGEPLTAEHFRYSIERSVTINRAEEFFPIYDIVGFFDYRDGRTDHIAGITVDGDRLSFRLGAPSPTFLERISLPPFCPVPIGTPMVESGPDDPPIPRAGPWFVSAHVPHESLILLANPNYPEPVAGGYPAIAYFVDESLGRSIGKWERGELDIVAGRGPELQVGSRTDERWGTGATGSDQRLIHRSSLGVASLVVNQGSASLAEPDVRRAVALALDRPTLSRYWGISTDEVLPLAMPGLVDKDRFPLDGPEVEEARALLAGRTVELRIAWRGPTTCTECPAVRDALTAQLQSVGISATFEESDDPLLYANGADSGFDLAGSYVWSDFSDPAIWMETQLSEALPSGGSYGAGFPRGWVPPELAAERDRLGELEGRERYEAALTLADRVADALFVIPYADDTYPQLISDRVGCTSFRAGNPWLDLVAACPG